MTVFPSQSSENVARAISRKLTFRYIISLFLVEKKIPCSLPLRSASSRLSILRLHCPSHTCCVWCDHLRTILWKTVSLLLMLLLSGMRISLPLCANIVTVGKVWVKCQLLLKLSPIFQPEYNFSSCGFFENLSTVFIST